MATFSGPPSWMLRAWDADGASVQASCCGRNPLFVFAARDARPARRSRRHRSNEDAQLAGGQAQLANSILTIAAPTKPLVQDRCARTSSQPSACAQPLPSTSIDRPQTRP